MGAPPSSHGPSCGSTDTIFREGYDVGIVTVPCSINSVNTMIVGAELSREASLIQVRGHMVGMVSFWCQKNDEVGELRECCMAWGHMFPLSPLT